jgi:CBS domain containing-hemolysin-like protein
LNPQRVAILAVLLAASLPAHASTHSGEAMDTVADVLAWVVLIIVPVGGIILFWLVHILPERIAEKRHHPQQEAIKTLCLLSLVFGGLLWPIAWLWAYTRPIGYRLAYGTEKHESYFHEMTERARAGASTVDEIRHLREELEAMQARGALPADLKNLVTELEGLHDAALARSAQPAPTGEGR